MAGRADAAAGTPEDMEAMMCAFCDQVLDGLRFGPEDNLFEQGMSSIDLAEIHGLIEASDHLLQAGFHIACDVAGLFEVLDDGCRE